MSISDEELIKELNEEFDVAQMVDALKQGDMPDDRTTVTQRLMCARLIIKKMQEVVRIMEDEQKQ